MPQGFVLARFNPDNSAYWLSYYGHRAAARLRTNWFWALRASFSGEANPRPELLFVVSSDPSPFPLPNTSLTLGSKGPHASHAITARDAELLVHDKPLPCSDNEPDRPLFLHTLPALPLNMRSRPLMLPPVYQLEEESFRRFLEQVRATLKEANQRRTYARNHCSLESIKNTWLDPRRGVGGISFGDGPSDPRAYTFDFEEPGSSTITPSVETSNSVYDDIMIYNQLCQDYRWVGVEAAIDWIERTRELVCSNRAQSSQTLTSALPTEPHLEPDLQAHALQLLSRPDPYDRSGSQDSSAASEGQKDTYSDSDSSSSGLSYTEYVDGQWEHVCYQYEIVALGAIRVIVLDISGTILNREGAIRRALALWDRPLPNEVQGPTLEALVRRYIVLEALANREHRNTQSPASLAAFVRAALVALAREFRLPIEESSSLFTDTFQIILNPSLWEDVHSAVHALRRHGYTLICQPLHSDATMQHLHSIIPSWFWLNTHTWTQHASPHFTADTDTFKTLQSFCEDVVGTSLKDSEILVVSTSIGRVLHSAQCWGHATAHMQRPGTWETNVRFLVGRGLGSPQPSIVVDGLRELCTKICAN